MSSTINMQDMRYLNLFERVTGVSTRYCFSYNDSIVFCVPRHLISVAVGEEGRNVKRLSEILRKRIRIIPAPSGIENIRQFIEAIVDPLRFKGIEIREGEVILTAGSQSKAALIGRNKRRFLEMQKIIKDYFSKGFRIV